MSTGRLPSVDGGIQPTIVDAKGDLIVATAADTVSRLAVGSNDQVLTADSSTATGVKWATASSGGMTSIASGNLTGASVTISSISGSYNNLQLILRDYYPSSSTSLYVRFNTNTGSNYDMVKYSTAMPGGSVGGPFTSFELNDDNYNQDPSDSDAMYVMNIFDYANANTKKVVNTYMNHKRSATSVTLLIYQYGVFRVTGAITDITIGVPAGTMSGGSYILYGVK